MAMQQRKTLETVWQFDQWKYAKLNRAGLDLGREMLRLTDGEVFSVGSVYGLPF